MPVENKFAVDPDRPKPPKAKGTGAAWLVRDANALSAHDATMKFLAVMFCPAGPSPKAVSLGFEKLYFHYCLHLLAGHPRRLPIYNSSPAGLQTKYRIYLFFVAILELTVYIKSMTHTEIIDAWPSTRKDLYGIFAADLGIDRGQARGFRHRNKIPPAYWTRVVAKAKARKIRGVTWEVLAA